MEVRELDQPETLIQSVCQGQLRALARLITKLENHEQGYQQLLAGLYPHTGSARIVGITGAPGAGKSSLIDALITHLRAQHLTVGVVAVDPSSPFSGGALLGDRIRMQTHTLDRGVYIRSVASRGGVGGLAQATQDIVRAMDVYGRDVIFVETAGVGQTELAIMDIADLVVLVLSPETGDDIQANKAGIMEIADLFVINKADLKGAEKLKIYIEGALHLSTKRIDPQVLLTQTYPVQGIESLWQHLSQLWQAYQVNGLLAQRRYAHLKSESIRLAEQHIVQQFRHGIDTDPTCQALLQQLQQNQTPFAVMQALIHHFSHQTHWIDPGSGACAPHL